MISKYENLLMNKIQSRIFHLKTDSSVSEVDVLPNKGMHILEFCDNPCVFIISLPVFFYNINNYF